MPRSLAVLSLTLTIGIALGLSAAYVIGFHTSGGHVPDTTDQVRTLTAPPAAINRIARDDNNTQTTTFAENPPTAGPIDEMEPGELSALSPNVAALQAQVNAEAAARRRLETQLGNLEKAIETLQQQLATLAERQQDDAQARSNSNRHLDEDAFIAAGFAQADAAYLAQRVGRQEMDMLYLRDQAIREGWLDTPRYEEAARELRNDRISLRDELGADGYDRFLYASGQSNRVVIDSVIDSSPGQTVGLQPGDVIMSYNGNRIFSARDLRSATTGSNTDEYAALQVDRGGQIIEYYLPGGPIGVRIGVDSVLPGGNGPAN